MIAKIWKKVVLIILIIACLFNIISKLVKRVAVIDELKASAQYQYDIEQEKTNKN
jgi:hypothetical protein